MKRRRRVHAEHLLTRNDLILILLIDNFQLKKLCCLMESEKLEIEQRVFSVLIFFSRQSLLAFALTHCIPDELESLLKSRSLLETQVILTILLINFCRFMNFTSKHTFTVTCTLLATWRQFTLSFLSTELVLSPFSK